MAFPVVGFSWFVGLPIEGLPDTTFLMVGLCVLFPPGVGNGFVVGLVVGLPGMKLTILGLAVVSLAGISPPLGLEMVGDKGVGRKLSMVGLGGSVFGLPVVGGNGDMVPVVGRTVGG